MKRLAVENWREVDTAISGFGLTPDQWLQEIMAPVLNDEVPQKIKDLFNVARSAMVYGCYFYPLFTLGSEQLYRVLEPTVKRRAEELGFNGELTFFNGINYLFDQQVLSDHQVNRMHSYRQIRNATSHPDSQCIFPPGLGDVHEVCDLINSIFPSVADDSGVS